MAGIQSLAIPMYRGCQTELYSPNTQGENIFLRMAAIKAAPVSMCNV